MPTQLGIESLAVHIPADRLEFSSRSQEWGLSPEFLESKAGVRQVSRKKPAEKASSLAVEAFRLLLKRNPLDLETVEMVCVVTQNPDQTIPHVAAKLQDLLGLPATCAAFDISLGCTGFVHGLSIATGFMQANGMKRGLLFTADPYSEIVDENDRNTALLFGDAASVTLLSNEPVLTIGKSSFQTSGKRGESLATIRDGRLSMDGVDVFNFAATHVPLEIEKVLKLNRLAKSEVGSFLIHSGSRAVVTAIAERAGLPTDRVPFGIEEFGNTVSSSLPILLAHNWQTLEKERRPLLLAGFGVGLSSATTVLNWR